VEGNRTKGEFIDLYNGTDTLSEAVGIHNTIATDQELKQSRTAIENSDLKGLISKKSIGNLAFQNILAFVNQATL